MTPGPGPLLDVRDLKVHFPVGRGWLGSPRGRILAVDGVDLQVGPGQTLGLVGESGCGKSTTARAVIRLHRPTAGQVWFKGRDLARLEGKGLLAARRGMQMVFQDPYASLDPRMTAGDLIAEPLAIHRAGGLLDLSRAGQDRRVAELMDHVGLARTFRDRYPHQFSGGQRQRIGLARALALNPELVLCDEPVSALDVSIQAQILNLLKDLQKALGLAYLFIAHDLAVVEYVATRVAVMYLGRIVEEADAADLYRQPLHPYTQALLSAAPIPDPEVERARRRIVLAGDVPAPDRARAGCPFYDRCPARMDLCLSQPPRLQAAGPGHRVACFLHHPPDPPA